MTHLKLLLLMGGGEGATKSGLTATMRRPSLLLTTMSRWPLAVKLAAKLLGTTT